MSALGQKRTYALHKAMSALPPKADMCGALTHVLPLLGYHFPWGGRGVVLAEAKGSVSASTTPSSLQSTVKQGYKNQVEPHVGTAPGGTSVLHGYAIGLGTKPGAGNSYIHIEETAPVTVSAAGSGGSPGPSHVVLGNYRGLFALLGADGVVGEIDAVLRGETVAGAASRSYLATMPETPFVDLLTKLALRTSVSNS